jgi:hypothetical protein
MLTGNNDKKKDCVVLLNSGRHWICVYGFMKEGEIMKWLIMNPLNSTDKSRTNQQLAQMLVGTPNYSQTGRIQQLGVRADVLYVPVTSQDGAFVVKSIRR